MTYEQAHKAYLSRKEIETVKKEIADLEASRVFLRGIQYTGMPKGQPRSGLPMEEEYLDKMMALQERLRRLSEKCIKEQEELEDFLETIKDREVRIIIRLRCIEGKTWETIGEEMYMSHTTAMRIFKRFWERRNEDGVA